jgi:hypothetical protein
MRSYYRLLILNLAVVGSLTSLMLLRIVKKNTSVYLVVFLGLLVANYAITRWIARQRGTSTSSFDIGLWASWVIGPLVTAMVPLIVAISIIERDLGKIMNLSYVLWIASVAWSTVRKSEREGWRTLDSKGPKSLSDVFRR